MASFYASPTTAIVDSTIHFYSTSTNNPISCKWLFTGGVPSTSTLVNPNVKYSSPGVYNAKLVVMNSAGSDSIIKTGYINITLPVKVIDFKADTTKICKNGSVGFTKIATAQISSYAWDFGDGATPRIANTAGPHNIVYSTAGYKTVTLIADGITKAKTNYINVIDLPLAFHASSPSSYCKGNPISITLSGSQTGTTYYLYINNTNLNLPKTGNGASLVWPDITSGKYNIIAKKENNNCKTSMQDTLSITEKPIPNTPEIFQNQNKLNSKTEVGNQWFSIEKGIITGAVDNMYAPLQSGNYFVVVTTDGCNSLPSNTIKIILTGIFEKNVSETITLFPNPINDILNIKSYNEIIINKIEVRNILGSIVHKVLPETKKDYLFVIDMSKQDDGYYTVLLYTDKGLLTYKVLKVK